MYCNIIWRSLCPWQQVLITSYEPRDIAKMPRRVCKSDVSMLTSKTGITMVCEEIVVGLQDLLLSEDVNVWGCICVVYIIESLPPTSYHSCWPKLVGSQFIFDAVLTRNWCGKKRWSQGPWYDCCIVPPVVLNTARGQERFRTGGR